MSRILLIGPLPPPMGGDTRHFATLLQDLTANPRYQVRLVNTSRGDAHGNAFSNAWTALRTWWAVLIGVSRVDVVSFHASDRGMTQFAPIVLTLARLFGRKTILRLFGGSFGDFYQEQGPFSRWLIRRFVFGADVVLLQTRRMLAQLSGLGPAKLVWFSTYIRRPEHPADSVKPGADALCSRFVFLGHLWRTKGLETLLEAAPQLPAGVTLDIFGPQDEYRPEDVVRRGAGRLYYGGLLSQAEADRKLWEYDCLVLPTFHPGEGYPGVIAEAFAHGLPVITTRWLAIPEIVDESCGLLVDPEDTAAFVAAVKRLHDDRTLWHSLRAGALARSEQFDHAVWARRFEELCEARS